MRSLFKYRCRACKTGFNEPKDGKCPVCDSFRWGDRDIYYAQLKAVEEAKKAHEALIREKLAASNKSAKKRRRNR